MKMVSLLALGLALTAHVLGMQAAPSQEAPSIEHYGVSILDLVRNGTVTESGTANVTYKHSLPEPNKEDSYEVNGVPFSRYPTGGIEVDPGFWEERGIILQNATR